MKDNENLPIMVNVGKKNNYQDSYHTCIRVIKANINLVI